MFQLAIGNLNSGKFTSLWAVAKVCEVLQKTRDRQTQTTKLTDQRQNGQQLTSQDQQRFPPISHVLFQILPCEMRTQLFLTKSGFSSSSDPTNQHVFSCIKRRIKTSRRHRMKARSLKTVLYRLIIFNVLEQFQYLLPFSAKRNPAGWEKALELYVVTFNFDGRQHRLA